VRQCERNNSAGPKVSAEGGEEMFQTPEQRFPCSHGAEHGGAGCPCSHGADHGGTDCSCSHGAAHGGGADPHPEPREDPMPEQGDAQRKV